VTEPDPTRKRALFLLAFASALMFAVGGLAACGDDDDPDSGGDTQTATEEPATEEPSTEDEGTGGGGGGGGDAQAGAQVFADNCATCHGDDGSGGAGPPLDTFDDPTAVEQQVRNGGGGMPAFEGQLSDQEIADVVAYVTQDIAGGGN